MGRAKAYLPFGDETLLQRVVRLLGNHASPVVVVARTGDPLPPLPPSVRLLQDREPDRGPMEGLAVGLASLEEETDLAVCTGCDSPLLRQEFLERLGARLEDGDIAAARARGRTHPLPALYRTSLHRTIDRLLGEGRNSLGSLLDAARTVVVDEGDLVEVDPDLSSLVNANTEDEYREALRRAGLASP
jgi:molybdopterin-guanine dinucleotide biosynthesis protein A